MSARKILSIVTFALIAGIIFFTWDEIVKAWGLMSQANLWILILLLPAQIFVYFAAGEMVFSYLRSKGSIKHLTPFTLGRMSLEMNFVNHILPSAGVSGVSYMNWRLKKYGIPLSRATMAQVVRFAVGFVAFILLLLVSVVIVTIDQGVNRWVLSLSALLVGVTIAVLLLSIFLLSSKARVATFSDWMTQNINRAAGFVTFGKYKKVLDGDKVGKFFDEIHQDYMALRHERHVLVKPFIWGLLFTISDVALFMITFWALGVVVNPAIILIAYGLAAMAGFFMVTPGGAGAYEAIMVSFLALAGVAGSVAIAGIVLTRVILLMGTIIFGYVFYQHALLKYGKAE